MSADSPQPTRRSLLAGAAWSVPLVAAAAAAPAASASPNRCGTLTWTGTTQVGNVRTGTVFTSVGGSSSAITITRETIAGAPQTGNFAPLTTGTTGAGPIGALRFWQQSASAGVPARQRVTITSVRPLRQVKFLVYDFGRATAYSDALGFSGFPTAAMVRQTPASPTISGSGSLASPFTRSAVWTTEATSTVEVTLTSPTASVTSFTFEYSNAVTSPAAGSGSQQWMSLSNPEFCF